MNDLEYTAACMTKRLPPPTVSSIVLKYYHL